MLEKRLGLAMVQPFTDEYIDFNRAEMKFWFLFRFISTPSIRFVMQNGLTSAMKLIGISLVLFRCDSEIRHQFVKSTTRKTYYKRLICYRHMVFVHVISFSPLLSSCSDGWFWTRMVFSSIPHVSFRFFFRFFFNFTKLKFMSYHVVQLCTSNSMQCAQKCTSHLLC